MLSSSQADLAVFPATPYARQIKGSVKVLESVRCPSLQAAESVPFVSRNDFSGYQQFAQVRDTLVYYVSKCPVVHTKFAPNGGFLCSELPRNRKVQDVSIL